MDGKIDIQKVINELYDLRDTYYDLSASRDYKDDYLQGVCAGICKSIEKIEQLKKQLK